MIKRKLFTYVILIFLTIVAGLFSRTNFIHLPILISKYAGDTLWALMVFWWLRIFFPKWKIWEISLVAILFSFTIEFSQFYHSPWIDNIRNTSLGGLIFGFGFKSSDLVCYLVGVIFGAIIDFFIIAPKI